MDETLASSLSRQSKVGETFLNDAPKGLEVHPKARSHVSVLLFNGPERLNNRMSNESVLERVQRMRDEAVRKEA